jgi:dimethylamine monooxygenase subunit A
MLRYFPFPGTFDLKMGTTHLKEGSRVETDEHYRSEISLKRALLGEDHSYYYQPGLDTEKAKWETLGKILHDLQTKDSENFDLSITGDQWAWENRLLNEKQSFTFGDPSTLPQDPLDWVGRQIQEDLIIMSAEGILSAGQLCFPSGWSLTEKIGKHFLDIHQPLPALMSPMMQAANKLLERLPAHAPIQRNNWGFRVTNRLDLSSRHSEVYKKELQEKSAQLTPSTIGENVFLRVEHQTLSRLTESGCILFTIHTYNHTLAEVVQDKTRAATLLTFIQSVPRPLLDYKLMTPFVGKMIQYLSSVL